ncbi:MAG: class I SAM-dependent methyltransferase [Candidatus Binatia bacterium]
MAGAVPCRRSTRWLANRAGSTRSSFQKRWHRDSRTSQNCQIARYTLVDFSPQMLELSRSRLAKFKDRTVFIQADFKKDDWTAAVPAGFDLIVSLQAVHELRHASRIPKLYAQLYSLLAPGGTILICDHVNSSSPSGHRAGHFMTVEEHLSTFKEVGFIKAREICPAADLSLMAAEKP